MIYTILLFIGAFFLLLFIYYIWNNSPKNTKYTFESWEKVDLPYINLDIQGKSFNMITDSAAAVSIIKRESLEKLDYKSSSRAVNLCAITEDGIHSEVVTIPINIKGKEVNVDFVVYNGNDIASFKRHGVDIDGILGVEFFKATEGIIDFQKKTVTL